jgi:hypothetical protein
MGVLIATGISLNGESGIRGILVFVFVNNFLLNSFRNGNGVGSFVGDIV